MSSRVRSPLPGVKACPENFFPLPICAGFPSPAKSSSSRLRRPLPGVNACPENFLPFPICAGFPRPATSCSSLERSPLPGVNCPPTEKLGTERMDQVCVSEQVARIHRFKASLSIFYSSPLPQTHQTFTSFLYLPPVDLPLPSWAWKLRW